MDKYNAVKTVLHGSIAEEAGIAVGDVILKIDEKSIVDILEYKFLTTSEFFLLEVAKKDGTIEVVEIEKDEYEDLGIEFEYPLMSEPKKCSNKCIFCFIDQLPKNMRSTLYFKDDDSRLSFLKGNYITTTNLSEKDIKSIASMRISPINISVHTTDGELRSLMLNNKNAKNIYKIIGQWANCGITMNTQIVLCKGVNDKEHLDKTISDLVHLYPKIHSISVVPVGITKYREGLYNIEPFNNNDACEVINQVRKWQEICVKKYNSNMVYLADEFYIKAGLSIPDFEHYEDFPQIENGVGMIASFRDEFNDGISEMPTHIINREVSIATGSAAFSFIYECARVLEKKVNGLKINVYEIKNNFFGENVTVAGLICGCDLIEQLDGKRLGEELFITSSMLRANEEVLLDDITLSDIKRVLNVKITNIDNDGYEFIEKVTGREIPL